MAKPRRSFRCSECGRQALAWSGQCAGCGAWNTLEEVTAAPAGPRAGARPRRDAPRPTPLREVGAERSARLPTGIAELDRVLGGGLVPGSLILLGGAPGIGKSTIAGMALANLAAAGGQTLYVSGEESAAQVRRRAELGGQGERQLERIGHRAVGPEEVQGPRRAQRPSGQQRSQAVDAGPVWTRSTRWSCTRLVAV